MINFLHLNLNLAVFVQTYLHFNVPLMNQISYLDCVLIEAHGKVSNTWTLNRSPKGCGFNSDSPLHNATAQCPSNSNNDEWVSVRTKLSCKD